MRRRLLPGLPLLALCAACDPHFLLEGSVRETDGGPLAGAAVALDCGGSATHVTWPDKLTSSADGGVYTGGVSCGPHRDCALVVTAPAHADGRAPIPGICAEWGEWECGDRCDRVAFTATLAAAP